MAEPPPVERHARLLAKVVIALGFILGPALMLLGFVLAIGGNSAAAEHYFYGGATGGGLALVGGFAALLILPRPPPATGPPAARVLRSPRKPPT